MEGTQMSEARAGVVRAVAGLMRGARAGSLATVADGQPFASLITPATAPDRSLLMLLSGLSPHTRHLREHPRCSIMLMGAATSSNPQTAPRISLTGSAALEPDPALKARWVALHPYAAFYADLSDFRLMRFRAEAGQFVGGFASAHRFVAADLAPPSDAVAAVAAAEARIIQHCNNDHAPAMDALAAAFSGGGAGWRMVACDVDGCDLAREEEVVRVVWAEPVSGPEGVRAELVRFAAAALNPVATASGPEV